MNARWLVLVLSVWMLAIGGCGPRTNLEYIFEDDFEVVCDGTPCGWEQSLGAEGRALYIDTVPGAHGVLFDGDGVGIRSAAAPPLLQAREVNQVAARVVTRCDANSSIEVRLTAAVADRGTVAFATEIVTASEWSDPIPDATLDPIGSSSPWFFEQVLGVTILKRGVGVCELDYIGIRTFRVVAR